MPGIWNLNIGIYEQQRNTSQPDQEELFHGQNGIGSAERYSS